MREASGCEKNHVTGEKITSTRGLKDACHIAAPGLDAARRSRAACATMLRASGALTLSGRTRLKCATQPRRTHLAPPTVVQSWQNAPTTVPMHLRTCDANSEQMQLFDNMVRLMHEKPQMTASVFLDWYFERVKESRTRLLHGSADSSAAIAVLIWYAARRSDVYTLRKLRAPATVWTQRIQQDNARKAHVSPTHILNEPTLAAKLDNILFGIAAKHDNWPVMYALVKDKPPDKRWTPYMCHALLRAKSTIDMLETKPQDGDDPKHALWNMFLSEFGHYIGFAHNASADTPDVQTILPHWVLAGLMHLYARCGKPEPTWNLLRLYAQSLGSEFKVLRSAPSRLLSRPASHIPGPRLLNAVLLAHMRDNSPRDALRAFAQLTDTPMPKELALVPTLALDVPTLEPSNGSVTLAMEAIVQCEGLSLNTVSTQLALLKHIDRAWGTWRARCEPSFRPMLLSLRVMERLLAWCVEANAADIIPSIMRFQQGLLRRELRWHAAHKAAYVWLPNSNEYATLQRWKAMLTRIQSRRWITRKHAHALYALALEVARHREKQRARKAVRLPHRHHIPPPSK